MAIAPTGVTKIFDCDSDGMDGGTGLLDTDLYAEGGGTPGSLKLKVSNTTSSVAQYDQGGAGGVDVTDKHFGFLGFVAGAFDSRVNGGVRIILEDINGNSKTFYVGGYDTSNIAYNGFQVYTVHEGATAQASSGTYDPSIHRYMGVQFKTTSKAIKENVWFDNLFMFDEYSITSGVSDAIGCKELADWDATLSNRYGLFVELLPDVYVVRTGIIWGSSAGTLHVDFVDTNSKVFFEASYLGDGTNSNRLSTLYKWNVVGHTSTTTNYVAGTLSGSDGLAGVEIYDLGSTNLCTVDFDDANIDKLQVYGGSFNDVGTIKWPTLTGANFESISTQFVNHGVITCNTFKIERWKSILASSDVFTVSSATFNVKYGDIISPTDNGISVSADIDITLYDITFSGTDGISSYDIENTQANTIEVGNSGTSNAQYKNENPGLITLLSPSSLTITGLPTNTAVSIIKVSDRSEMYRVDNSSGDVLYSFGSAEVGVVVDLLFIHLDYDPEIGSYYSYTLLIGDKSVPGALVADPTYSNP